MSKAPGWGPALVVLMMLMVGIFSCQRSSARADPQRLPPPSNVPVATEAAGDRAPPGTSTAEDSQVPSGEQQPAAEPVILRPFPGVTVKPSGAQVEIDAVVCLDDGWLEQVACTPGTREHEALVIVQALPSSVHAALLMAGLEAGSPGQWRWEDERLHLVPPTGDALDVLVRYDVGNGPVEHPVARWIHDGRSGATFPDAPWVFAGSRFDRDATGEEFYVADVTGSVIGLVTFGDEVVGFMEVIADESEVQAPQWKVNSDAIAPLGTPVKVILRRRSAGP